MNRVVSILVIGVALAGCRTPTDKAPPFTADQSLILAAYRLDTDGVQRLLATGANVNARFGNDDASASQDAWKLGWPMQATNWTPLLAAINSPTNPEPTRTTKSTTQGLKAALARLIRTPERIIRERDAKRLAIVRMLLDAEADINLHDGYGATPLYDAIERGDDEMAFELLKHAPEVNTVTGSYICPGGYTPLHHAVDNPDLVRALLSRGADPNAIAAWGWTPLTMALYEGHTNSASMLIAAGGVIPMTDGLSAQRASKLYYYAVHLAHDQPATAEWTIRLLLQAGVDPNGDTPEENVNGETALHVACRRDDPTLVKLLLQAGANVNARDVFGSTPLHRAAESLNLGAAELLVAAGADPAAKDLEGRTPFDIAAAWAQYENEDDLSSDDRLFIRETRVIAEFLRNAAQTQQSFGRDSAKPPSGLP